ncbi:hypothetical protein PR003_g14590 [Phytophthora rubi]|uniref:Uncharacterized protein n=1 Tax=Phytophthora rubi TaxID=129364 RepID=A0A6A4F3R4_9STRA|nr:hypothetical protein PR002_g14679 [Phytophthora rubi]KAE9018057.1 hypothetical protein PR001_g14233 [Phytophthora rubi]KAE9332280.1 hypothetical protein PR003_g14590 [Phytophthora rubi]
MFLYEKQFASLQGIYRAFEKAGSLAVTKFLFKMEKIPAQSITTAFQNELYAPGCDLYDLIDLVTILYDDPNISCEVVCAALQNAASLGHLRIVDFLMNKPEIAQSVKHVALVFQFKTIAKQLFNFWRRSNTDSSPLRMKHCSQSISSGKS